MTTESEFADLFATYRSRVQGLIVKRLHPDDRHLAEDLVAETFLSVWVTCQRTGRPVERPFALLATVAKRRICDHYRKAERRVRERPADTGEWQFANRAMDAGDGFYTPAPTGFRTATLAGAR